MWEYILILVGKFCNWKFLLAIKKKKDWTKKVFPNERNRGPVIKLNHNLQNLAWVGPMIRRSSC